jgi:hypothetical protein
MKTHLNWSYKAAITTARKLPETWHQKRTAMAHMVAYIVKAYNIPTCLVINTYQTRIHLVPTRGDRTWETKGAKHIQVLGIEDKKQITTIVSSSTNGTLLPLQIVFQGTTNHSLPPMNKGRRTCYSFGFHSTFSSNNWSTLETTKQFIKHILIPYHVVQMETLTFPKDEKMVWLIDCWSVHKREFLVWMKQHYPCVCIIFVPTNCTSTL